MTSVVIAAHNEAAVIDACLRGLVGPGIDVIVVANGCTDRTAEVARRAGVEVIERSAASKPGALNAGDAATTSFPRMYIDADVVLSPGAVTELARTLESPGVLAAVPVRRLDLAGRPLLVRAYFAVHSRLPATRTGLYGRGVIALSQAGRARFNTFPDMTADDLFLDSLFSLDERAVVASATVTVRTPLRTRDLVRRLVRVRAGNSAMRAAATVAQNAGDSAGATVGGSTVRAARRWSWLTDVVLRAPWLAPAGVCYAAITLIAEARARRGGQPTWGRDDSTRISA